MAIYVLLAVLLVGVLIIVAANQIRLNTDDRADSIVGTPSEPVKRTFDEELLKRGHNIYTDPYVGSVRSASSISNGSSRNSVSSRYESRDDDDYYNRRRRDNDSFVAVSSLTTMDWGSSSSDSSSSSSSYDSGSSSSDYGSSCDSGSSDCGGGSCD